MLAAIGKNLDAFRSIVTPGTAVMAVVKANAYGHGIEVVAPVAAKHADWLGVNSLEEALAVRELGIDKPIAILGHTELDNLEYVVSGQFRQVVYREDVAAALSNHARDRRMTARVHLKVETGTHRQGIDLDRLGGFVKEIQALPNLDIEGVYTHFANIEDTLDPAFAQFQIAEFRRALAIVKEAGANPSWIHASATSGALLYPETGFNMIRVGIGTYGIWPSRETQLASRERGRQHLPDTCADLEDADCANQNDQARRIRRLRPHLPGEPSDEDCHTADRILRRLRQEALQQRTRTGRAGKPSRLSDAS